MIIYELNETHDPTAKSWVESANDPSSDFPIQNLPFCMFWPSLDSEAPRAGIAIGDKIFDLYAAVTSGVFEDQFDELGEEMELCDLSFMAEVYGPGVLTDLRRAAFNVLLEGTDQKTKAKADACLFDAKTVEPELPFEIGDYTDFYCSIYHATNVGSMFRPDNPLLPNYKYVPIGYHGRASSIVVSGNEIKRPKGQNRSDQDAPPVFIPCKNLDYEMEVGFFVGQQNDLGTPVPLSEAEDNIIGLCLVNDWSARDIQAWEYQPLGPFLAKNFATTISPFVVTMEALAPFRTAAFQREAGDPAPLDYLADEDNESLGGIDLKLEVYIETERMRREASDPVLLSSSNMKDLYWTIGQMLTHHTSNGCNLQSGDLIATGTISGPDRSERGSMLELSWRGSEPIELPNGEVRRFLEDGDEIIMKGYCEREGFRRIGFGECRGRIIPAD